MSPVKTLFFAALAACLAAYIFFVETPKMDQEAMGDRLLEFEAADVAAVELIYPDQPDISARRGDEGWRLTKPLEVDGDDDQLSRLVKAIAEVEVERRIPMSDVESLTTYGLEGDGTQAKVLLQLADGTKLTPIVVGDTTPVGFSAFVRLELGEEIVVTPLIFHTGVKKTVFDLREKRMFDFDAKNATGLSITVGEKQTRLQRQGDDWAITEPVTRKANKIEVDSLINGVKQILATDYLTEEVLAGVETGLDAPALSVQLEVGGVGTMGFKLGDQVVDGPRGHYLQRDRDGQVAKVAEWVKDRFDKDLGDLLDNKVFDCGGKSVARFTFKRADGNGFSILQDDDGQWIMDPAEEGQGVRQPLATRTSRSLINLAGKRVLLEADAAEERFDLDSPAVVVEVIADNGDSCGKARASAVPAGDDEADYFFMRESDGAVMEASQFTFSTVDMRREDFLTPR